MVRRFSQNDLVESDIEEIYDYIEEDNPDAAQAVADAIFDALDAIRQDPERFPRFFPAAFKNDRLHRAIALPFRNYLIFYELHPKEIRVLYVHHVARDFEARHRKEKRT